MTSSAKQIRAYTGPALFSYGFRPFFLFGALWAALAVAVWLPMLNGLIAFPTVLQPVEWHVHELIYGYVPAVIAGFLLTAVPNWTGRLPVVGRPLAFLFAAWVAGRVAILTSSWIGAPAAAVIDLTFLAALAAVIGREIVASHNTRNLKVLVAVGILFAGNAAFHYQVMTGIGGGIGIRLGLAGIVTLIMVIGGRIIPSFTRNWLAQKRSTTLPAPFERYDLVVMGISIAALLLWVLLPTNPVTAVAAAIAGAANILRLSRWAGAHTTAEPLVLVLHVGFAFVPIGFLLLALGIWRPDIVTPTGALHGWTAGAIGLMTLAVMTRASFGHTGQPMTATPPIQLIYALAATAALARIFAAFDFQREPMLYLSATAWVLAFLGFVVVYAPLLARRQT
ncbi:MAG: NnrS family protein [Hyphomicrobium sp.]|jgi:uncharacterized protein involved in response to NO|nr:NnrS family protein [Hyphomicrobium sp.]